VLGVSKCALLAFALSFELGDDLFDALHLSVSLTVCVVLWSGMDHERELIISFPSCPDQRRFSRSVRVRAFRVRA